MSKAESSGEDSRKLAASEDEDDDLASFPAPPPLPRERAALARRKTEAPPLLPRTSLPESSEPKAERGSTSTPPAAKAPAPALPHRAAPPLPRATSAPAPGQDGSAVSPPLPPAESSQRPGTSQRPWHLYGLAVLIVLGVGAVGYFFSDRPEASSEEENGPRQAEAAPTTDLVGGGQLLIDARPWGEVTSLVDSDGEEIELPSERQTPLVLDLTPGRYTVFLTHPELIDQRLPCEVEVSAHVGASCRLDLLSVTSEDYWEDVGW